MKTRTQKTTYTTPSFEEYEDRLDLDSLSDEELEALLFENEAEPKTGFLNLPTIAGLSMIVVGVVYIFQKMGIWGGLDLTVLASMLPWLAGILIILLGFGVLSWRPKKKKRRKTVEKDIKLESGQEVRVKAGRQETKKKRLRKSRDKKIAGVCGGIAEYLNIDPTIVRIAFVIGLFINGLTIPLYLLLAFIMSKPEPLSAEERITIIRDS